VHSDNRVTSGITMILFAIGIAASLLLILAHDRPFVGEVSVGPGPLLQVIACSRQISEQRNGLRLGSWTFQPPSSNEGRRHLRA
jgi:hypothetical protein